MAKIDFTDGTGAATLDNGLTGVAGGVASRFSSWTPWTKVIGPRDTALGTGVQYQWAFRTDYGATFELREIPNTSVATALRLIRHLINGGTCSVTTSDGSSRVYSSCGLAPGMDPQLQMQDPIELTYRLSLSLINLAAASDMLCEY